jgi:hypothetical protein
MQAPGGDPGPGAVLAEVVGQPLGVDHLVEFIAEDEVSILVGVSGEIALELLRL